MKLKALILSSLLAVAGCEKSSNVAAMQDEVTAVTAHYKHTFEELSHRLQVLEQRGRTVVSVGEPAGLQDVRRLFVDTNKRLNDLKAQANQAPGAIANAAKSENARLELTKLRDELDERFEKGETEVNAQIDQVEQWLQYIAYRPTVTAAVEPAKTEPVPEVKAEDPTGVQPNGQPNPPTGEGAKPDDNKDAPKTDGKTAPKGTDTGNGAPKADANPKKGSDGGAGTGNGAPKADAKKDEPKKAAGSGSAR